MKKTKISIIIIFLIAIIASISGTYARYYTKTKIKAKLEVAKWLVKVNNTDITTEEKKEFTISDMTFSDMTNARDNKFCPGREVSFTVGIDGSESMVSMEYSVDIDLSVFNDPNITVDVTSDYGKLEHTIGSTTYTGTMKYNKDVPSTALVTVKLKWLDNEDYKEEDAALGSIVNNKIKVPVTVLVNQYSGV